ncbi:MAG TPA: hypothetical protein VFV99_32535 [Kofleriaceae bacterium]|nr:hypothetical protein [Kofleriaceae bacterium]
MSSSSRERAASGRRAVERKPVAASSSGGASTTTAGALAAATWLRTRGMSSPTRWHVEIALDVMNDRAPTDFDETRATRFHLNIYTEEWGVHFVHRGRSSWIRVTDIAFVHGRDEYKLLGILPALKDVGRLLRQLEQTHEIKFQRQHAAVHTNMPQAERAIREWIASL